MEVEEKSFIFKSLHVEVKKLRFWENENVGNAFDWNIHGESHIGKKIHTLCVNLNHNLSSRERKKAHNGWFKCEDADGKSFGGRKKLMNLKMAKLWCALFRPWEKEPSNLTLIILLIRLCYSHQQKGPNTDLGPHTTRNNIALMSLKV